MEQAALLDSEQLYPELQHRLTATLDRLMALQEALPRAAAPRSRAALLDRGRRLRRRLQRGMQPVARALRALTPKKTLGDFRRQRVPAASALDSWAEDSDEWRCLERLPLSARLLGVSFQEIEEAQGLKRAPSLAEAGEELGAPVRAICDECQVDTEHPVGLQRFVDDARPCRDLSATW